MFLKASPRAHVAALWALGWGLFNFSVHAQETATRPPDIFGVKSTQVSAHEVIFHYQVPPHHALERSHFRFEAPVGLVRQVIYPPVAPGSRSQYRHSVRIRLILNSAPHPEGVVVATAQGCDLIRHICYPPFQHVHALKWTGDLSQQPGDRAPPHPRTPR